MSKQSDAEHVKLQKEMEELRREIVSREAAIAGLEQVVHDMQEEIASYKTKVRV